MTPMIHSSLRRLLPAIALTLAACSDGTSPSPAPARITALPRTLSGSEQALITASNRFSSDLLRAVSASRTADENVFLSPLSATMALGMAMNGAKGTTFDEMRATLGFGAMTRQEILTSYRDLIALLRALDPKVDFRIANSVWSEQTFAPVVKSSFVTESKDYFDAKVSVLDFRAAASLATINAWVKDATNGKITSIVDDLSPDLVMLLVNAIYFKGDWREAFPKGATKVAPFTTARGATVQVPMMSRTGDGRVGGVGGRTIVESSYGGDAFAMTILLPAAGETVEQLVKSLTLGEWDAQVASLHPSEIDLSMPRFKLERKYELNPELIAMGMPTAFDPERADFTGIADDQLFISFVVQKTYVDVNEVGAEAAAVTGVGVSVTSLPQRVTVRVDRPFVFAIREKLSGTILFMGKVVDPTR